MAYKVTFRWYDTDTFCTNICVADTEDAVKQHYAKHQVIDIREAAPYELEDACRRGMPIIHVK